MSPDGRWVVYRHDPIVDEAFQLWAVPLAGGPPVRLSGELSAGRSVRLDFKVTTDSQRVVFASDQETPGTTEVWSVPISGPPETALKLNPPVVPGTSVGFELAPDGVEVVLWVPSGIPSCVGHCWDLYSVSVAVPASSAIRLNPDSLALDSAWVLVSPDSSRVVAPGQATTSGAPALLSVPIQGPAAEMVRLEVPSGDVPTSPYQISPNSQWVLYGGGRTNSGFATRYYSVPIDGPGSASTQITRPLDATESRVVGVNIAPDSSRVLYRILPNWTPSYGGRLYSVPIQGPAEASIEIGPPDAGIGGVGSAFASPDSALAVLAASLGPDYRRHLYSVPIDGPWQDGQRISVDLPVGGNVTSWNLVTNDGFEVYGADSVVDGSSQLYRVPVSGPVQANLPLSPTPTSGGTIEYSRVSPDGRTVFFWGDFETTGAEELFAVPFDGPADAVAKINAPLPPGGDVFADFSWTPDGRFLVYRADQEVAGKVELYVAAVPLFRDGFETGTTGRWSSASP